MFRTLAKMVFDIKNWLPHPRLIIIWREQGSSAGGEKSDERCGFVKQIKRHLEHENTKVKEMLKRSTFSTKKDIKTGQQEGKTTAEMKNDTS
jgi:hemerythrin-like domain-containing protein